MISSSPAPQRTHCPSFHNHVRRTLWDVDIYCSYSLKLQPFMLQCASILDFGTDFLLMFIDFESIHKPFSNEYFRHHLWFGKYHSNDSFENCLQIRFSCYEQLISGYFPLLHVFRFPLTAKVSFLVFSLSPSSPDL